MEGWIKLHRKICQWEWWKNIKVKVVFIQLLLEANHEPNKWQGHEILTGQIVTSLNSLANNCGLTTRNVRTALSHLKSTGELTSNAHSKFRIITLNNFSKYQITDKQPDKQSTSNRQSTDNTIRMKECKNDKKKEVSGGKIPQPTPAETFRNFILDFTDKTENYKDLVSALSAKLQISEFQISAEIDKFISYWSELTKDGKKQKWELERTFEVQRRLATWFSRVDNYSHRKNGEKTFTFIS